MEEENESILIGYPNVISYECSNKIKEQMEKNICKINIGKTQATGFFCKIPFPDQNNMLPVFITNNHVISKKLLYDENIQIQIDIKDEKEVKKIDLNNRLKYTNEEYDITIIEIKEKDNINNYLQLDDIIMNDLLYDNNINKEYINETIYIIQYPENKLSVSYGILDKIYEDKKYDFIHRCCTKEGSSGSPILNLNNKIIGLHKKGNTKYNKGAFLNYPIKEFIKLNLNNDETLLNEFNKKYELDISDININKLGLQFKNLGNDGLNNLCKIDFKELKELCLCYNEISDIKALEIARFEKLEKLKLDNNEIKDINILEYVKFKELRILELYINCILDIKVLEKVKFEKLEHLLLNFNGISDISILDKVNFKELKQLDLSHNKYRI